MRRRLVLCFLAVPLVSALAGTMAGAGVSKGQREGGTFRVVTCTGGIGCFDYLDPALTFTPIGYDVLQTSCGSLVRYPDKAPPGGYRLVPELATSFPRISHGGRIYTFRLRKGVRFNTGAVVTGQNLAHALDRILDPRMQSQLSPAFVGVVGAQDVLDGKAAHPSGVTATRTTITFRLTQPDGAFLVKLVPLCAVPLGLPVDPEGVGTPLPSAGPYYASQYVRGRRIVLERNRFYRGPRPHHVARFEVDLQTSVEEIIDRVRSGTADWGQVPTSRLATVAAELARRYGVNKSQFFVRRGLFLRLFVLNTSSPLFRNNAPLRRAVNFAVERKALIEQRGLYAGTPIDHYLSPDFPGYRNVRIYPLVHPNLARARALTRGHTRSGKAVVYIPNNTPSAVAQAQILQRDLKRIGLELTIEQFPAPILFDKLATRGEPFDLGLIGWQGNPDPSILDDLFNGKWIGKEGNNNYSYFNSPRFNRMLNAANRLTGTTRRRAFGRIDLELARDAAPAIAYGYDNALTLVSSRTGCVILNPTLDLEAVCLKS
jgi:peptide/nickel transport system substrate-binding protein